MFRPHESCLQVYGASEVHTREQFRIGSSDAIAVTIRVRSGEKGNRIVQGHR